MKTVKLNKSTKLYKVLKSLTIIPNRASWDHDNTVTMCEIVGNALGMLLLFSVVGGLISFLLAPLAYGLFWLAMYAFGSPIVFSPGLFAMLIVDIAFACIAAFIAIAVNRERIVRCVAKSFGIKEKVEKVKEPGFIKMAWRSFKDKTCVKVEFE